MIPHKIEVLDIISNDPHVIFQASVSVSGGLQEHKLRVDQEDHGRMCHVLRRVTLAFCGSASVVEELFKDLRS